MLRKIANMITKNIGLKILAAVIAVILWMVVVNVEDPEKTKVYTVPVTIENTNYLEEQGMAYLVEENSDTVSFSVTGKRSVLDELNSSDFIATADLSKVIHNEEIPISINALRYSNRLTIQEKEQYVKISVENLVTKQYEVKTNISGELAAGYVTGEISVSPNVVEITGPQSVMSHISSVEVRLDVTGCSKNIEENVVPVLLDENGIEVSTERLKMNWEKLDLSVEVCKSKSIPVTYGTSGDPEKNVRILSVTPSKKEVRVYGKDAALEKIDALDIPDSALDVSGITEDCTREIDITSCLPEGIFLVDKNDTTLTFTIDVEARTEKTLEVPTGNFVVENLKEGLYAVVEGYTVGITVSGYPSDLDKLSVVNMIGTIDGSKFAEGSNSGELKLDLDPTVYQVVGNPKVSVKVSNSKN